MPDGKPLARSLKNIKFGPANIKQTNKQKTSLGCNTLEKWKTKVMQNLGGQIRYIMGNEEVAYNSAFEVKVAIDSVSMTQAGIEFHGTTTSREKAHRKITVWTKMILLLIQEVTLNVFL